MVRALKSLMQKLRYAALPLIVFASIAISVGPTGWKTTGQIVAGVCRAVIPGISAFDIALGSVVIVVTGALLVGIWKTFTLSRQLSRFTGELKRHTESAIEQEHGTYQFTTLTDQVPFAFCHGLIRPRIYISTSLLKILTPSEVDAVLAHERAHQLRRDPLRIAIVHVLTSALSLVPGVSWIRDRYLLSLELKADQVVKQEVGDGPLRSALHKLMSSAARVRAELPRPVSGFNHLSARLGALEEDETRSAFMLFSKPVRKRVFFVFVWVTTLAGFWTYGVLSAATLMAAAPTCKAPL